MTERELTGLMYEILSSERGRLYLELFDKHVLRLEMTADELDSAKVYGKVVDGKNEQYRTKLISASRPIDLVIITNKRFIPIEVKIEAADQTDQCCDYWHEAEEYHNENSLSAPPVLYYLSPQGDFPSWESAGDIGYENDPFIRSDKIDDVAFSSEGFYWIDACNDNPPKDISQKNKLKKLYNEIKGMIDKAGTDSQRQVENIMRKFFTALDARFDEKFCREHHLKRGGNRRAEIGDAYDYKRFIDRFFGRAFSWPSICLYCTDAAGNVIKFDDDKELWFRMGCYNGKCDPVGGESTAFCAGFMIFSNEVKQGLYKKEADIKPLLDGKNILPQEFVDEYDKKFNGLVGRTDLHDAHGNTIDFYDVDKTLSQFRTQEDFDGAVDNIMTEIETLLRRLACE